MRRDEAARATAGLAVLLLPYFGVFTVIPLAVISLLDRSTRTLSVSLALLTFLGWVLGFTPLELPLYVVALSFVVSTFPAVVFNRYKTLLGSLVYLASAIVIGYPVALLASSGSVSPEKILFLTTLGSLSGAFLLSAASERDFAVPFGSCMVMWFFCFSYPLPSIQQMLLIYIFALVLGVSAYWLKVADVEAVLSEILICFLVVLFGGIIWFMLLLCFYLLGSGFTKYKYTQKLELRIAQARGGVRGYRNVYSNSLVPLGLAICFGAYGNDLFVFAFLGAVATATGDTLASEIGETSRTRPRMITTFRQVDPGVDGGVTLLGEASGLFGATIIGILALAAEMTGHSGFLASVIGGFLGTNFDSLLGATVQRRGRLSNDGVNLLSTLFGAIVGGALYYLL